MVAGKNELAREQLIELRASDNFIISKAAEWRLSNTIAEPIQVLDERAKKILKTIIAEVGQEVKYKPLNFSKTKKAYVTYFLIVINLIFFCLEIVYGGSEDLETLYFLGALVPENVRAGEWWRLLNANFLHFGWLHLTTNMLGLYFLGRFVENILGRIRYLAIFLLSGIMSMTTFAFLTLKLQESNLVIKIGEQSLNSQNGDEQQLLVGASAAIMGLVGAIAAISFRDWLVQRSKYTTKRLQFILLIIVLQFCFDFTTPQVSSLSHFLGLFFGFVLTSILLRK
jgi:rhomboid protease GluP